MRLAAETTMATMTAGMDMVGTTARPARSRALTVAERNRARFEAQRAARRGPTLEVFFAKHIDNSRIVKADDPERRREMRMFSIAMSVLFALVMVYVWQHFSAIEVGYKIEAQKTQVTQLQEKNRELELSEAQLTQPGRIDTIARQLGMDTPQPGQVIRNDGVTGMEENAPVLADAGRVGVLAQ
jgi:cell division protein FtsL